MKALANNAWLLSLGNANAVLLAHRDDLTLVDAGFAGKEAVVYQAISELGRSPTDLKHLVFTHGHPDHIGSAAALVQATGARTYMHALDAPLAETGGPFRAMTPAKGVMHHLAFKSIWRQTECMTPFGVDETMADGYFMDIAGGLQVVGTPGHCAGQVAFVWKPESLLIGGDVFINIMGITDPLGFEDEAEGHRSQRKIADLDFQSVAFGHGPALTHRADEKVRQALRTAA